MYHRSQESERRQQQEQFRGPCCRDGDICRRDTHRLDVRGDGQIDFAADALDGRNGNVVLGWIAHVQVGRACRVAFEQDEGQQPMNASSQLFDAPAASPIPLAESRVSFDSTHREERRVSAHLRDMEHSTPGFAVTVRSTPCISIEDAVGCEAYVLTGQAWITAEGDLRDTIATTGTIVPLKLGVRFNVSAFRDITTVLIAAPRNLPDVGFSLQERNGIRVLTVTSGKSRLPAALSGSPAAIAAFARRCFATARTAAS
jgi:hypothetical protein